MNKIATPRPQRVLLAVLCLMLLTGFLYGQRLVMRSKPGERLGTVPVPVRTVAPAPARSAAPDPASAAQNGGSYSITQSVIPGGGGTSTNGTTSVTGSVGQAVTATSSGGSYTVSGGFWVGQGNGGCPAITVNPSNPALPTGAMGVAYAQTFTQSGGSGTLTWSNPGGGLPGGLTLDAGTGGLSGTPTAQGTFNFTVRVMDGNNCMGERAYTLVINAMPCPTITVNPSNPTLTAGTLGTAYTQTFTQAGGAGTITWSVSSGALPAGLALNPGAGVLSGTPTNAGTSNFAVRATDANQCMGERAYTLTTNPAPGSGLQFFALPSPVRLLDTRPGASPNACAQPNVPR